MNVVLVHGILDNGAIFWRLGAACKMPGTGVGFPRSSPRMRPGSQGMFS